MNWLKSMSTAALSLAMMSPAVVLAGEVKVPVPDTGMGAPIVLSCPAGSVQSGGSRSQFEAAVCVDARTGRFNGPYVGLSHNGKVSSRGQYLNGNREGLWRFYNEDGVLIGETQFHAGNYDGMRIEYHANGRKALEETWVEGKREGLVRHFDIQGDVVKVEEFHGNRLVATR